MTIVFAKYVPPGHVTGMEYVPDSLEGARDLAALAGVFNTSFQVGDIHDLPFSNNTFDIVHADQIIKHIADPIRAFREIRRVVKQGGIVAVRESASLTGYPESEGITAW